MASPASASIHVIVLLISFALLCTSDDVIKREVNVDDFPRGGANETGFLSRAKRSGTVTNADVITAADADAVLEAHNARRAAVSPAATNMRKMVYDAGLAAIAEAYSRRCVYAHNAQRSSGSSFSYVGENLYISSRAVASGQALVSATTSWADEDQYYTYSTGSCSDVCGHYTQIVWDDTYAVGCGVTTCRNVNVGGNVWSTAQIVVCNYGPAGNYRGQKPYETGTTCSQCPAGVECICGENGSARVELQRQPAFVIVGSMTCLLYQIIVAGV